MIFKRFFTPAHLSHDQQKRLDAIDKLSADVPQDKTILHELAFNDSSADVSLKALTRLNSFALWQKMASIAEHERVRRHAQHVVELTISGQGSCVISDAEKRAFLIESATDEQIKKALSVQPELLNDAMLIDTLLNRSTDSAMQLFLLLGASDESLKRRFISVCNEPALLQRYLKKCDKGELRDVISQRIAAIEAERAKPEQLQRDITLVLSKYQALTEKSNYEDIDEAANQLNTQYNALMTQCECLSEAQRQTLVDKYTGISRRISAHLERLKPVWEKQQHQVVIQQFEERAESAISRAKTEVARLYQERLTAATLADVERVNSALQEAEDAIEALNGHAHNARSTERLNSALLTIRSQLDSFASQQHLVNKLIALTEKGRDVFARLTDNKVVHSWLEEAGEIIREYDALRPELQSLPGEIDDLWKQWRHAYREAVRNVNSEVEHAAKQLHKQLSAISRLIDNGRYKPAMAKFSKLSRQFANSGELVIQRVKRRFDDIQSQIERLQGWQDYLALPRKPALLEQARALVEQTPDDVHERVKAIRVLRKQWNSLLEATSHSDLQQPFDEALEQAFAPCKAYFEQQDMRQRQAYDKRNALVNALSELSEEIEPNALFSQLEGLKKQWREAPKLNQKDYAALKLQWDELRAPFEEKVRRWQQDNEARKAALVKQAEALVGEHDTAAAAEKAKLLQQQWKQIGHAGHKSQNRLWQAFRQANDAIFTALSETQQAVKAEVDAKKDELSLRLESLLVKVQRDALDNTGLNDAQEAFSSIGKAVAALPAQVSKSFHSKLRLLEQKLENARSRLLMQQYSESLRNLARFVETSAASGAVTVDPALDKRWSRAINASSTSPYSQPWLTFALQIESSLPTEDEASDTRRQVQLEMLEAKLERNETLDVDTLIEAWLSHVNATAVDAETYSQFANTLYKLAERQVAHD